MLNKYLNLKGSVRPKFTPEKQSAMLSFLETLEWDLNRLIANIEKQPNATIEILESFRKEFAFGVKGIEAVRAEMNN